MKFRAIFQFELRYQLSRIWTWLIFAVLLVINFLMTRDLSLSEALYEDFFVNSPFAIAKTAVFGALIWLVVAPVVAGTAAARDVEMRMYPLIYTASVNKAEYLGGRFLAAFVVNALILLAVPAGILLAIYSPGVNEALIGPFRPAAYITGFGYIALANAFIATAIQFSLAALSGRSMAGYVGSVLLVFMGFFIASMVLFHRGIGTLLDPIGIRFIVEDVAHLWTTAEKKTRLLSLEGIVLKNRLLWCGIAIAFLAFAYFRFQFRHHVTTSFKFKLPSFLKSQKAGTGDNKPRIYQKEITRSFGFAAQVRQSLAIAWTSFWSLATSWAGLALLIPIPLMTVVIVLDQMSYDGGVFVPNTIRVINELTAALSEELSRWVIIPAFIIVFAGELIWRERDARLGEINDTMPAPEWIPFTGKFMGLGLMLVAFSAAQMAAGMVAQIMSGYDNFEIGLYVKILFGLQLTEYLLFAVLALAVHVVVNQKYIGHLVAIIAYVFIAMSSLFGVEHNMLVYGAGPDWAYTEMRGFGQSLGPWLWFKFYWAAWALLLAVIARVFWVRGKESSFKVRLGLAKHGFTRLTAWTGMAAVVLIIGLGGFIFYNTNVLNKYLTASEMNERKARYERTYGKYKSIAQPIITAANLHVEIFPDQNAADINGTYHLVNRSEGKIDSIVVTTVPGVETGDVKFDRTATLAHSDENFGHNIYALQEPLQPNDSVQLNFKVHIEPKGFRESGVESAVVANGSFLTNAMLPTIGYQQSRELIQPSDRREHGLTPRPLIASLYDTEAPKRRGQGIAFEAVIGTSKDQVAVAPGALRRSWTKGERSYFHYSTDRPIGSEWVLLSARYAVHEAKWQDSAGAGQPVLIRVFHQPGHSAYLDRLLKSIRASLDYYTKEFGPYRYGHLTVAEAYTDGTGLHADASMLTHGGGFPLWNPHDEPGAIDFPFAVVAHEVAHQWTVPYANVEGAPVMSESLAWYYGLKVVEHAKGVEDLRRYLHVMRQPHPIAPIRRGEPLLRGLDQYMSYRKGPFALYAMSEYIGEDKVNTALRRLLEKHQQKEAPLATTLDLYRELQAVTPDSMRYLLHDLFEVNTFWHLSTEQTTARQTSAGAWEVTLSVQARKTVVDEQGVETIVPVNDMVEIGVFAPTENGEGVGKPLYLQKHRVSTGKQKLTVTVLRKPASAGIDPNFLLIDLKMDDNLKKVINN